MGRGRGTCRTLCLGLAVPELPGRPQSPPHFLSCRPPPLGAVFHPSPSAHKHLAQTASSAALGGDSSPPSLTGGHFPPGLGVGGARRGAGRGGPRRLISLRCVWCVCTLCVCATAECCQSNSVSKETVKVRAAAHTSEKCASCGAQAPSWSPANYCPLGTPRAWPATEPPGGQGAGGAPNSAPGEAPACRRGGGGGEAG